MAISIFHKILLLLLAVITKLVDCKVYERCELAQELKSKHKLPIEQIPVWVCIVKHESAFNTSAMNHGSGDHGLFQISDMYWCSPPGNGYACNNPCSVYEDDDISDDIECVKRIFNEHQRLSGNGFNAWVVYSRYCKHNDITQYIHGCFDNDIDNVIANEEAEEENADSDGYKFPPLPSPPKTKTTARTIQRFSNRQQISTTRPVKKFTIESKVTTVKPHYSTARTSPFKRLISAIAATTVRPPKTVTTTKKRLTTLKPFSVLLQQKKDGRTEHKRENRFILNTDYTFVRTLNGFRLTKN